MGSMKYQLMQDINDRADALMYSYAYGNYGLFSGLTNASAKASVYYPYHICSADGQPIAHSHDEAAAIASAEGFAKAKPGTTYYVTKCIAKSVTQQPVVTTRL